MQAHGHMINGNVIIDEVRWPRMFTTMRRGGMYRRCNCAGCASCTTAARRLVRGVVSNAQWSRPYRPEQWGDRYQLLSRRFGPGTLSVLTDVHQPVPTVLDVSMEPAGDAAPPRSPDAWPGAPDMGAASDAGAAQALADDGDAPQEELLHKLVARRIPTTLMAPTGTQTLRDWVTQNGIPNVASMQMTGPLTVRDLDTRSGLARLPSQPGIYLVQWRDGQYLGKADNLRQRIPDHLEAIRRFVRHPGSYRFFTVALTGDPRPLENRILTELTNLVAARAALVGDQFNLLGMTNQQREFEFF